MSEARYMDTATVACYIGKTPGAVRTMVQRAQIPHIRLGHRTLRFDREAIDKWMFRQTDRRKPT